MIRMNDCKLNHQEKSDKHGNYTPTKELRFISDSKVAKVKYLFNEIPQKSRRKLWTELIEKESLQSRMQKIVNSIKEVIHHRVSTDREHEGVRSTLISACCRSDLKLKTVSQVLELYKNRNFHKLKVYKERRDAYMSGRAKHMSGDRYSRDSYGFTNDNNTKVKPSVL